MAEASVTFALGSEEATVVLPVDLPGGSTPLVGDVSGTFGDAHISGDLNLVGDVFIEGLLTGIDTFHVQGNGFTVFFQNGGRADLHGKPKAPWGSWGTDAAGWVVGDRLAVAPFTTFLPTVTSWGGTWTSTTRPVNSITPGTDPATPNLTLIDGSVAKPEVANLSQSIVLENLGRGFHFHDSAGVQSLSDVKFLNCGSTGIGNYPVHFHQLYDSSRGSVLERVVVEGGKNHAFVVHGSHGVTLKDCVAYNTINDAYWWDVPLDENHTANNSDDTLYQHCLAIWVKSLETDFTLTAFLLGAGRRNGVIDSVACCVQGGENASGYHWTSKANQNIGGTVWLFERNIAHNNRNDGIFVWQNDGAHHIVEDFVAYRNQRCQIEHGAYTTSYHYRNMTLMGGNEDSFRLHARNPGIVVEDTIADKPFRSSRHTFGALEFAIVKNCQFPSVIYNEMQGSAPLWSFIRFEDCNLTPANFVLTSIHPQTVIEIVEAGALVNRWAGGWT